MKSFTMNSVFKKIKKLNMNGEILIVGNLIMKK
jgi:hypothetical protein